MVTRGHTESRVRPHNRADRKASQADNPGWKKWAGGRGYAGGSAGVLPEPAIGVFTTAGTCQERLRRHYVIGYAAPDRTRLPSSSAVVGFGGGGRDTTGADGSPGTGREVATRTRARGVSCHAQPQTTCPLRARSAGQRRVLTITRGQPDAPAYLRTGRLTRCAYRPS